MVFNEQIGIVKSWIPADCLYLFHRFADMYVKLFVGEGVMRRLSLLHDLLNKLYIAIGCLSFIICCFSNPNHYSIIELIIIN